jgi:hypothetical protein
VDSNYVSGIMAKIGNPILYEVINPYDLINRRKTQWFQNSESDELPKSTRHLASLNCHNRAMKDLRFAYILVGATVLEERGGDVSSYETAFLQENCFKPKRKRHILPKLAVSQDACTDTKLDLMQATLSFVTHGY